MSSPTLQKARGTFPFFVALAALGLIVVATEQSLRVGYDGVDFNPLTGEVIEVDPDGPAAGSLLPGDAIVSIQGVPIADTPALLGEQVAGDSLQYLIQRDGHSSTLQLTLTEKPGAEVFQYLMPLLVAFSFWAIGVAVMAFGPAGREARLFLAFTLVASSTLAAGAISSEGPNWASTLFNILIWFAGPVAVHLHLRVPEPLRLPWARRIPVGLYSIAVAGSLPFVLAHAEGMRSSPLFATLFTAERLYLSLNLLMVVLLLAYSYRSASSIAVRQRVRLIVLGTGVGLLLVLALSLLPGALLGEPLVPYDYAFAFLLAIPVSYAFVIVRHRLLGLERFLSRGAAYALVFALLAAIYLALTSLIQAVLPGDLLARPLINMSLVLLLAGTAVLLYRRIQAMVDFAFYGGWYDFRTALESITHELEKLRDAETLAITLAERLHSTLRLQSASVFIAARDGSLRAYPIDAHQPTTGPVAPLTLPPDGTLIQGLSGQRAAISASKLAERLESLPLTKDERAALNDFSDRLLVPVPGSENLQGLLALGPPRGGDEFTVDDLAIVHQVARHAGVAIETVRLASEVRRQAEEVRQLNKRLVRAREQERKALARRLHDEAIQALVGVIYQLAHLEDGNTQPLRDQIRLIVEQLRGIIRDLRPQALDTFGLQTAVRTEVRERQSRNPTGPRIDLSVSEDGELTIPDDIAICAYRVIQEALNNMERHAEAGNAEVRLILSQPEVQVIVQDNGRGFMVPKPLGLLLEQDHFGLVGLRERVQLLDGTLEIRSIQGEGTIVHVRIPLPANS